MASAKRQPRKTDEPATKQAQKSKPSKSAAKAELTPADYLRELQGLKDFEEEDFAMFSDEDFMSDVTEFIPTGCLGIDKLINGVNGGFPVGRISEVCAWEGVGKSTLMDQSIAQCQMMGGVAALIDTERSRNSQYQAKLGVDLKRLLGAKANTVEDVFKKFEAMLTIQERFADARHGEQPPLLLVWDSVAGTPAEAELVGDVDDAHVALAARIIKMNLRRMTQRINDLRVAPVLTNHFYKNIGGGGGFTPNTASGGSGIKYFTSLRLWLSRKGALKLSDAEVGQIVEAKLKKTRIHPNQGAAVEIGLVFGGGFDNAYTLYEWGKKGLNADGIPWIVQSNAHHWIYPPGGETPIHFNQKFAGLGNLLRERPDIYTALAHDFLNG